MAAGINDKFKKVSADNSYAVATTVKTARTVGGGTTLEAFDLSKWADATAVNFLTYRKTTDPVTNVTTVTNRTGWTALVNTGSNTLTNLTIAPGYTDLGHQVGDYIEPVQMSKWANDLVDGILVSHNQDGKLNSSALAQVYPVGSTYYNKTNSTNPATLLGFGTWARLEGVVLGGRSEAGGSPFNVAGGTVIGADTHTLTVEQMPSHSHSFYTNAAGGTAANSATFAGTNGVANGAMSSAGGGQAHPNIQRTLVGYLWERTA